MKKTVKVIPCNVTKYKCCLVLMLLLSITCITKGYAVNKSQQENLTVAYENASLKSIIKDLEKKTKMSYMYNNNEVKTYNGITFTISRGTLKQILDKALMGTKLCYQMDEEVVVIRKKDPVPDNERKEIKGKVVDEEGKPVPGVSVVIKGTNVGTATDNDGEFAIYTSLGEILVFSFIGMEQQEIKIKDVEPLKIVLKNTSENLGEVVINGYFERSKETFTGSATTVTGEQIQEVSQTNLIQALAALTPGMHVVENNAQGSNPNAVPQIIIRGTTSLIDEENQGANNPLIVLDGVEINMEELYDLEIEDVERIDVLKDAAATSIYGDKAANGVIVVTRKRVKDPKLRLRYNFTPTYSIPDITSMRLCNASEKLELERLAGLYDAPDGEYDIAYKKKLMNVNNGVNTDWISKPLRISFGHNHSLSLSGRANSMSYRMSTGFRDSYGVMKGDNRRNYSFNLYLGYFKSKKFSFNYRCGFSLLNSKNSPYGDFSEYSKLNPYNPVYDEFGDYIINYPFDPIHNPHSKVQGNPLYDATLSSFDNTKSIRITNSVDARWEITDDLIATSQISYNTDFNQTDKFVSPDDSEHINKYYLEDRGIYTIRGSNGYSLDAKVGLNYRILFGEGSMIRLNIGSNISKSKSELHNSVGKGFRKDWMTDLRYAKVSTSTGYESVSSKIGFYGSMNTSYRQKYNLDFNIRTSGSSKYGDENKWGPFLSGGLSWNLHKEGFLDYEWLDIFRLRVSSGYTGSSNFDPYQAMTVYEYDENLLQYTGIGAVPMVMGNPDLKWQRTLNTNYGLTISVLKNRFSLGLDYYIQKTEDVIMAVTVPPSIGTQKVKVNYGEIENKGYDISLFGQVINTKDIYWGITLTGSHVIDELKKISPDLLKQNEDVVDNTQEEPNLLLLEGGSQYDIYGVRSAGIDPATGREVYIDKEGNYVFEYDYLDKVAIGNKNPTLRGNINTGFRYKNFGINITASYTFGSDKYNMTLAEKVEKIDPYQNVDRRAFTDRWKAPGDLKRFLAIQTGIFDENKHTSRFVEKFNELYLSNINFTYEISPKLLKKWKIQRLTLGFGMSDVFRLSTMKYERGTSYPYCRQFNITIKPTF